MIRCRILGHDWRPDKTYLFGVCRRCGVPSETPQRGQADPLGDEIHASLEAVKQAVAAFGASLDQHEAACPQCRARAARQP